MTSPETIGPVYRGIRKVLYIVLVAARTSVVFGVGWQGLWQTMQVSIDLHGVGGYAHPASDGCVAEKY